jgi:hypothetical protein
MAGLLIGEGVDGLTYVADSTYPPYWRAEIAAGVLVLVAGIAVLTGLTRRGPAPVVRARRGRPRGRGGRCGDGGVSVLYASA